MLKISESKRGRQAVNLRLEGSIAGPWVGELKQVCEPLLGNGSKLSLDLADVSFADEDGVALLSNLKGRGVKLRDVNPFVDEQLKSGSSDVAGSNQSKAA